MNWLRFLELFLMWFPPCAMFVCVAFICECVWHGIEQKRRIKELARVIRQWDSRRADDAVSLNVIEAPRVDVSRSARSGS